MRLTSICLLLAALSFSYAKAQLVPGSMDVRWNEGAQDCTERSQAPLQVHPYNPHTFILRENLCATFEAPFVYLLIGSTKAVLIDSGDVPDPSKVPLASTVMTLLPRNDDGTLPLLVVHTHRHLDHRAGDAQFTHMPNVHVVGYDIDSVRRDYNLTNWPNGLAEIDLGERTVDVIPSPGHSETEVSFYDRSTGLFFSGDFLMPARLLIENASADFATAQRVADFVRNRPVSFVLGGHIEMNSRGELYPWQSHYHPNEHVLQMTKNDLLALPAAVRSFNGFYTKTGNFVMMDSIRILIAFAVVTGVLLIVFIWALAHYARRRIRARRLRAVSQA